VMPRRPGRFTLAAACGVAGIAFGLLMNLSVVATYGGEMSAERFLTLQARALPFDLMHVLGNVTLALVAGPAMIRLLIRFRERFIWTRVPAPATGSRLAAVAVVLVIGAGLLAPPERAEAAADVQAAVGWLGSVQNSDGGFGPSSGDDSSVVTTSWAILGLAAAGVNAYDLPARGTTTPIAYLRANSDAISSTGDIARTIMALRSAGVDPRRFGDRNLVIELLERRRANGSYEGWPNATAFAVIALRQAGVEGGTGRSTDWLRQRQNDDGGWGATVGAPSDADTTGAVLQAVGGERTVRRAVSFLRRAQRPSGGFPLGGSGGTVNTQTTGWAIQGLIAAGLNPARFRRDKRSAAEYLAQLQQTDGHFRYSAASDQTPVWVTASVLVAAAAERFPIEAPPREPVPAPPPVAPGGGSVPVAPGGSGSSGGSGGGSGLYGGTGGGSSGSGSGSGGSFGAGGGPSGSGGSPGSTDNSVRPRPIDPGAQPSGPDSSTSSDDDPFGPGSGPDPATLAAAEAAAADVEEQRAAPDPVAPAGIGLGLAGITAGGLWWFGRRRAW